MLGVFIDLVIIIGMQAMLEGVSDDWRDIIFPTLAITFGNFGLSLALVPHIGLWALGPMALLTFAILFLWCKMAPRNAAITTVVLLAIKVGVSLALAR